MPPMQFDWMPMFRAGIPKPIRPWVYVIFAFLFQMSGGLYMGALSEIVSGRQLLREDVLMCLYCNLAGMTVYFPLLFRLKFHFSNKLLLLWAAAGLMLCQFLAPLAPNLPCLWALCLLSGFCKIQGTFECMSVIQLWITPKRDFGVFFPVLHIFILGAMQVSDFLAAHIAYAWGWEYMHLLMAGLFMVMLVAILTLTRRVNLMPDVPLRGIDWLGGTLWLAWLLQVSACLCYGHTLDWLHSSTIRTLVVTASLTLVAALARSFASPNPFIAPAVFKNKRVVMAFAVIAVAEALLATERVLEEVFYEECMGYGKIQTVSNDQWGVLGVVIGCVFALVWMHCLRLNELRLVTVGFFLLAAYVVVFYQTVAADFDFRTLRLLIFLRTMAYALLSASAMVILNRLTTFQTFFMALSVFNMFHMIIGGAVGSAVYSYALDYYMADNFSRYAEFFDHLTLSRMNAPFGQVMEGAGHTLMFVSIKQILGWVAYACVASGLILLLYKVPVIKKSYKTIMDVL